MKRWMGLALPLAIAACDKPSAQQTTTAPSASTTAVASASAAASATPSASASAAPTGTAASFAGTYKSAPGQLYYPTDAPNGKDWKDLAKWQGDNATAGVGEGAIRVEIDPAGKVSGELDAPLGPATLNGVMVDGAFSARVDRNDPSDRGFTGTAIGKAKGDDLEGTMRLSLAEANAFRTVTFTLKKK